MNKHIDYYFKTMTKETTHLKKHLCLKGISLSRKEEEDGSNKERIVEGLAATTHPDKDRDIFSKKALEQMRDFINDETRAGNKQGSFRGVSLYHDWVREQDPTLDEAGFILPTAEVIQLDDNNYGLKIQSKLNEFYKGSITPDEIDYRIKNGAIAGFSVEFDTDDDHSVIINRADGQYRFIDEITEFGGVGFARARMIANPNAIIYKEIEQQAQEAKAMKEKLEAKEEEQEESPAENNDSEASTEEKVEEESTEETKEESSEDDAVESKESTPKASLTTKELLESKEFSEAIEKHLKVKSKVIKSDKGDNMDTTTLCVKEMNEAMKAEKFNSMKYKEAQSKYFAEHPEFDMQLKTQGIPLNTSLQVKCAGTKLQIVGSLQVKDTLDTTTNTTTYTQSPVEFADVYLPGIIETFNQQTNLWGYLPKRDHLMGGDHYGWRITTSQQTGLSVDKDDTSVNKQAVSKLKLRTEIKVYRLGVSVTDYMVHHARASIGDLFALEVEKTAMDLMKDINGDLFTEQVDSGNQILGLEAVADSAGNTTLYGLTRTAANRLAPASASDTYVAVGGAITSALVRDAMTKVEVEGARRENLRIIVNPNQRDAIFELEDGNLRYFNNSAQLGFNGEIRYDGVLVIVDSDCQTDALFVVDFESEYIVVSKAPQLVGLARVGAAEEAYVETYIAHVYEKPRRIHMKDTLS